jgi:hypothetical protein
MATSQYPESPLPPSTVANIFTATSPGTLYTSNVSLVVGTYEITCISTTIAYVVFFDATGAIIGSTNTTSGIVQFNLATAATKIQYYTNTGSLINVSIALTGIGALFSEVSGTLDTITTSGTYTTTGNLWVMCIGGGGSGGSGSNAGTARGLGGSAGGISSALINTTTSTTVTIGAKGATQTGNFVAGNAGGSTTFGAFVTGAGGAGGGTGSGSNPSGNGVATFPEAQFIKNGSIGSGGNGGSEAAATAGGTGAGSGIGTGGNGGTAGGPRNGTEATGQGSGGGGGAAPGQGHGGAGSDGVIYILRGF